MASRLVSAISPTLPSWFQGDTTARLAILRGVWPAVVGPMIAAHTEIAALDGDTLRLRVDSGPWSKTISDMRREILAKLTGLAPHIAPRKLTVSPVHALAPRKEGAPRSKRSE